MKRQQAASDAVHLSAHSPKTRRQATITDDSTALENVVNKGPLLTIALALFGEGSFIATRSAHQSAYVGVNATRDANDTVHPANAGDCIDLAPLSLLFVSTEGYPVVTDGLISCIRNTDGLPDGSGVIDEVVEWLINFTYNDTYVLTNVFNSAAFLANQAWLQNQVFRKTLSVSYDLGADSEVPQISRAGVILISILLGLDLSMLLALAIYASIFPRWTAQLDSFAMLRLGASIGDRLPLLVGRRTNKIKVLDEIEGWVGDEEGSEAEIGKLGLGAGRRIERNRRYASYKSDSEPLSVQERKQLKERLARLKEGGMAGAGEHVLDTLGIRS